MLTKDDLIVRPNQKNHLATIILNESFPSKILKRAAGIEPASSAWKAEVLPLHNARMGIRILSYEDLPMLGRRVGSQVNKKTKNAISIEMTYD